METSIAPVPPALPDKPSLTEVILGAIVKTNNVVGGVGGLIVALVVWVWLPTTSIAVWVPTLVGVLLAGAVLVLVNALLKVYEVIRSQDIFIKEERARLEQERARRQEERSPAEIHAIVAPFHPFVSAHCVLIVKWSASAAPQIGSQITVSVATETHELPLGSGCIRKRQDDGNIQVTLDTVLPGVESLVKGLLDKNATDQVRRVKIGAAFDLQGPVGGNLSPGTSGPPSAQGMGQ